MTAIGPAVPAFAAIDSFMQRFMEQHNIYGGSLAIPKDGEMVYSRSYTYAEPGYPLVLPTSLFRIASLSKPITGLMVHKVLEEQGCTVDVKINGILYYASNGGRPFPICSGKPINTSTPVSG